MRRPLALLAAFVLVLGSVGQAAAAGGSSGDKAKLYYLSLGDSLAAGVQPIGNPDNLFRTDRGYAEQLLATARASYPKLSLEKLGCPGETTTTMIAGGICSYDHGSQLDEAVAFLQGHRQFVAFITIDIGANDFPCQAAECIPAGVGTIQSNLPAILAKLRAAAGPGVPIVGMTLYNPFLANWLLGPDGQLIAQASASQLMGPVNGVLKAIYASAGIGFADLETAFSSNDFATQVDLPGAGTVPLNVARICMWTWVCAPAPYGPDNHANEAGYGAIAHAFAIELGL
jgi:lysophospholipase L1-like esterase